MKLPLLSTLLVIILHANSQTLDATRSVNWQNAGLSNDCYQTDAIINFLDAGGVADGITSNDAAMSTVLSSITSGFTVVYFPPGNYLFNAPIDLKSNMLLKGAGATQTTFTFNLSIENDAIKIKGSESATTISLVSDVSKGDFSLSVTDASGYAVGNYIKLFEEDDMLVTSSWGLYTTGQIFKIENISGNTIYLDNEVRRTFYTSRNARIKKITPKENTGIEDLKIIRQDATPKNTSNIYFKFAANCWVKGVSSYNCNYAHIEMHHTTKSEVSGCYLKDAFDYGDGGRAYGVVVHYASGDNLITDNVFNHLRHSMLLQAGANGNVMSYNYSINPYWTGTWLPSSSAGDLVLHGNYPYANLLEGNTVQNIVIDDSHGANGRYNTFFRNRAELYGITMSSSAAGGYQNFIGNEITNSGFLLGLYSLSGTGHFEHGNNKNGTIIPSGTSSLPESTLYLESPEAFYLADSEFPPIGTPNAIDAYIIEAEQRYVSGAFTKSDVCFSHIILPDVLIETSFCFADSLQLNFKTAGIFNADNNFSLKLIATDNPDEMYSIGASTSTTNISGSLYSVPPGTYYVRIDAQSPYAQGQISNYTIIIGAGTEQIINATINEGELYILPDGSSANTTGTYVFNFETADGCDSVVTINLAVNSICAAPTGIFVSDITANSAIINWFSENDATAYQLQYRKSGTSIWQKVNATGLSKTISGLISSSTYQYRIRSKCGSTFSPLSALQTFSTTAMREADLANKTEMNVQVFPNPSDGTLYFTADMQGEIWINVYDLTGKLIFNELRAIENDNKVQLQLTQFSDGVHLVYLVGDNFSSSQFIMLKHF